MKMELTAIGTLLTDENGSYIQLESAYAPGLLALEGFSHIQVLWWFSECDHAEARSLLQFEQPYRGAPETMGVFATRSPARPNPIALTAAEVTGLDPAHGRIRIAYIDAYDGTPVLDIKPYTPSLDRVETPAVPAWCSGWPQSTEASGDFDWEQVFNF